MDRDDQAWEHYLCVCWGTIITGNTLCIWCEKNTDISGYGEYVEYECNRYTTHYCIPCAHSLLDQFSDYEVPKPPAAAGIKNNHYSAYSDYRYNQYRPSGGYASMPSNIIDDWWNVTSSAKSLSRALTRCSIDD